MVGCVSTAKDPERVEEMIVWEEEAKVAARRRTINDKRNLSNVE